jgi:hypothetical protein
LRLKKGKILKRVTPFFLLPNEVSEARPLGGIASERVTASKGEYPAACRGTEEAKLPSVAGACSGVNTIYFRFFPAFPLYDP